MRSSSSNKNQKTVKAYNYCIREDKSLLEYQIQSRRKENEKERKVSQTHLKISYIKHRIEFLLVT